ncbi:Piso0_001733 [Millerozyma farinosa CBS 7064]|uniref:Piso0_001733 protein n=1 Tax=Pichia sorbitophila (strain ATCC MYA-4447 / BCRC 22081 / CBS 7064 / NBRC 10061 / NRRL Y-12695) TaxID=559304 RepID=G8YNY3_PICSO|nr:Piso0_001733 [Millerozyma farinosa CBS 7064]
MTLVLDGALPEVSTNIPVSEKTVCSISATQSTRSIPTSATEVNPEAAAEGVVEKKRFAVVAKLSDFKKKKKERKLSRELHAKKSEFIRLVLERLPFLYSRSTEVENAEWIKIAYDLKIRNKLIPDIIRYQTGPTFFISFGSIASQIKREFFSLYLGNDKRSVSDTAIIDETKRYSSADTEIISPKNIKIRKTAVNDSFEFFTSEEIRSIILSGDHNTVNFYKREPLKDASQSEWFHKWGYVYVTEPDCYRALELELGTYHMEIAVLESLYGLNFNEADIPNTLDVSVSSLGDQLIRKYVLIREKLLPEVLERKSLKVQELNKSEPDSERYHQLICY